MRGSWSRTIIEPMCGAASNADSNGATATRREIDHGWLHAEGLGPHSSQVSITVASNSCMARAAPGGSGGCAVEDVSCHAEVGGRPSRSNSSVTANRDLWTWIPNMFLGAGRDARIVFTRDVENVSAQPR